MLLVLFGITALLSGGLAGDYKQAAHAGYTFHTWVGMGMAGALALRLIWGIFGVRSARFSQWVPRTAQHFSLVGEDLRGLLRFRIPQRTMHQGVAGLVQVIGLLVFSWLAITGVVLFFALEPGVRATGWLRLVKELHEAGQVAAYGYLALHVGAVALHAIAGDRSWRQMFFMTPPPAPPVQAGHDSRSGDRL